MFAFDQTCTGIYTTCMSRRLDSDTYRLHGLHQAMIEKVLSC